ncbi:pyridoxamine 5'-phosphate oxidase family protein [Anaerovorax odorimutans]|uniref:pyridoxamine 5'-phosphate oxidase family protein n=1 Tax=Anaerovorax odorimutans TaxID=109327 RepID=UPI00041C75A4|nr:pyridoxamine 5'-phosphate oxidase family protein [Anaerovorax odorimutans]
MFRELRNSPISELETKEVLLKGEYGVFSTTGSDNYAYGIPLNYVYLNGCIYVHGANIGHRIDNIKFNPSVSFCVVDSVKILPDKFDTLFRSAIIFGQAQLVNDQEEKKEALIALLEKYSKEYMENGIKYMNIEWDNTSVVKIAIEHITGKAQK